MTIDKSQGYVYKFPESFVELSPTALGEGLLYIEYNLLSLPPFPISRQIPSLHKILPNKPSTSPIHAFPLKSLESIQSGHFSWPHLLH
jgi:hypothetical protein